MNIFRWVLNSKYMLERNLSDSIREGTDIHPSYWGTWLHILVYILTHHAKNVPYYFNMSHVHRVEYWGYHIHV
jgi:hypothetical protein